MKAGRIFLTSIIAFALIGIVFPNAQAGPEGIPEDAAQTIRDSIDIVKDFAKDAGQKIPPGILENSAGIAIIPDVKQFAFFEGGRHGTGVLLTHDQNQWSLPVFAYISGRSLDAQIGVSSADLLLVFCNRKTISKLQGTGNLDFGLDLAITAGPMGGTADWSTIDADVLAYELTEGLFAGFYISEGSLTPDPDMTFAYYVESVQPTARGYYEEGREEMLVNDLLRLDDVLILPNVPSGAMRLKRTMDRLSR